MELQEKVESYLRHYGIKKRYLASLVGIYPCQMSQWFAGKYRLSDRQIKVLEDFCNEENW